MTWVISECLSVSFLLVFVVVVVVGLAADLDLPVVDGEGDAARGLVVLGAVRGGQGIA